MAPSTPASPAEKAMMSTRPKPIRPSEMAASITTSADGQGRNLPDTPSASGVRCEWPWSRRKFQRRNEHTARPGTQGELEPDSIRRRIAGDDNVRPSHLHDVDRSEE